MSPILGDLHRSMPIRAITFDFWRTLFRDARGDERKRLRMDAVVRASGADPALVEETMKAVGREFLRVHIEEQRTLDPEDAVPMVERALGVRFSRETAGELAETFATAILDAPPDPIEGALDAVRAAAERYPVGLISDSGISPGRSLEVLLERYGFRPYLRRLTFSDEVGVSKPRPAMYHHAAEGLAVRAEDLLHIGDLEPTDVKGALEVGARAALFGGDNPRYVGNTRAHYTFTSWREFIDSLPDLE